MKYTRIKGFFKALNLEIRLRKKNVSGKSFGFLRFGFGKGRTHVPSVPVISRSLIDPGTLSYQT